MRFRKHQDSEHGIFILDDGATFPGRSGVLGLTPDGDVVQGYEDWVSGVNARDGTLSDLTTEQKAEIGEGMARHWLRWAGLYDTDPIYLLSVRQPFAHALVHGPKDYENRKGSGPKQPCWLAIQAGLQLFDFGKRGPGVRASRAVPGDADRGNSPGDVGGAGWTKDDREPFDVLRSVWPECPDLEGLVRGCVIGLVRYEGTEAWTPGRHAGKPWATGPSCWKIGQKIPLRQPVAWKGAQGLVPPPSPLREILLAELAAIEGACAARERGEGGP